MVYRKNQILLGLFDYSNRCFVVDPDKVARVEGVVLRELHLGADQKELIRIQIFFHSESRALHLQQLNKLEISIRSLWNHYAVLKPQRNRQS